MTQGAEAIDYDYHNPFKDPARRVHTNTLHELAIKGSIVRFLSDMNDVCIVHFTSKGVDPKELENKLKFKGVISEQGLRVLKRITK